ncbi:acetoin utilization AcuB family protein [Cytobacillus sp. FSL W7-1323]|uniref:acetoin utilization AcuB family protein n=1 Tax=Cytobacillus TaxID=2675230 RepID=UPI00278944EE|nr:MULTISPECIES: acetoin utilization AcuB family protein [Cytobacillus]MDQ0186214.1 acetoin utilization protein AcuB [Cytobacillus kochii]MEA1855086.1 acetoin utilization AcuB family protein [Cytobacillus sp. OWB-43]MED1604813.1 acetoin utilization AcuB family protein [Cytobacillus kochii]
MIVEEMMKKEIFTLTENHLIADALQLMRDQKIRHLPIIDEANHLIGLVTDRDIRDATPSILDTVQLKEGLSQPIKRIMKTDIISGHPLDFVEDIAATLYEHRIGCMPILNDNQLVGIVTQTDLLHTYVELTGAHQPGSQIEVRVPNRTGKLFEVTSVFRNLKANILSVLVYPDKEDSNYKIIVLRVQTMNPLSLVDKLREEGHSVLWPIDPRK